MSLGQYLQETQAELKHVAWPTQTQTIVYTVLVIAISVLISFYLGVFDYVFTSSVKRYVGATGNAPAPIEQPVTTSTSTPTTPSVDINSLLPGGVRNSTSTN